MPLVSNFWGGGTAVVTSVHSSRNNYETNTMVIYFALFK